MKDQGSKLYLTQVYLLFLYQLDHNNGRTNREYVAANLKLYLGLFRCDLGACLVPKLNTIALA